jgi:ParB-like chromosome segregation protein Spo0J
VDEHGVLIAGHLRVAAAARLGLKSIPVIVARGWSEDEKQAYRLADNELAARGSWDPDLLRSELRDLKFGGFDLDLIGFEPHRLEEILAGLGSSGLTDPDSVPEIPEIPSPGLVISGCLPPTGSAVATAQTRRMSRRCWRERGLT